MRVLQLIDSLEAGGAERMAINYANAIYKEYLFSALIATRGEGCLKIYINQGVEYLFLEKKRTLDFKSIFKLRKFIKLQKIDIIHSHGSSFFLATIIKIITPSVKIIWHDHNGDRNNQTIYKNIILWFCSLFFNGIFAVSLQVENWNRNNLNWNNVLFIPNFTKINSEIPITNLKGNDGKRIVCLSNLRNPKNHLVIISGFLKSAIFEKGWSLHFVGRDYFDDYSDKMKKCISDNKLEDYIFLYGTRSDVFTILKQSSIGLLGSTYEGFPVSIIEYGLAKLPVISTNVGYCSQIIKNKDTGILFDPKNLEELANKLFLLCNDKALQEKIAKNLNESIVSNYSEKTIIRNVIKFYQLIS